MKGEEDEEEKKKTLKNGQQTKGKYVYEML